MDKFQMNGIWWTLHYVDNTNPLLVDRTGDVKVACTDPLTKQVYISNRLRGEFLKTVVMHELAHCAMFSYNLIDDIHRMVKPEYWMEAEEYICNIIADHGLEIDKITNNMLRISLKQLA